MKKLLTITLLCLIVRTGLGQAVPDIIRTPATPATGANANNRSTVDANLYASKNLRIPRGSSFSLNGAKDSIGYVMFNTTSNRFGVYIGGGNWQTYLIAADIPTTLAWTNITGKPTTLSGYNISDAYTQTQVNTLLSGKANTGDSYTKTQSDTKYYLATNPAGYISSYTETDPTVPSYSKSLTAFSVIKASTDPLYQATIIPGTSLQYYRGDKTFQTLNTSAVPEGFNQYWTTSRFNTAFAGKTSDDLTEGSTNLYYTTARSALKADKTTTISASGNGIAGGGSLAANRNISLDFNFLDARYATSGTTLHPLTNGYGIGTLTFNGSSAKSVVVDTANITSKTFFNTRIGTAAAASTATKQSIAPISSKGLIVGNSTVAAYLGQNGVDFYLNTDCDQLNGTTIYNQAVPGNTILQQQVIYLADANKATYDWIVVEIGLNDLNPAESATTALGRYQTLINNIRANSKSTALIITSAMTPCKQRLIDVYGPTGGLTAYQKWLDMNVAIMGAGTDKITSVDSRVYNHVTALNDGLGNLAQQYDMADGIHENNAGRLIIASAWREMLQGLGYLTCFPPQTIDNNFANSADSVKLKGGLLVVDYKAEGASGVVINNKNTTNLGYSQLELKANESRFTVGIGNNAENLFGLKKGFFIRDVRRGVNVLKIDSLGFSTIHGTGMNITDGSRGVVWRPYTGGANYWAGYFSNVTPGANNFFLAGRSEDETILNSTSSTKLAVGGTTKLEATSTAVITNVLDNYASDLSGSYIARSKVDKAYADRLGRITITSSATSITIPNLSGTGSEYDLILTGSSLQTVTLPADVDFGARISITGSGTGGWKIAQGLSNSIKTTGGTTTTGVTGFVQSTAQYNSITIEALLSGFGNTTTYMVKNIIGAPTFN